MEFGNDPHPKWSEKEEMTLIFLSALNPTYRDLEIQGEINALFGNERSLESVRNRIQKDERAIQALKDLVASNPVTVAKFWQSQGVVDRLPLVPMAEEEEPTHPKKSLLFHKLRVLFPLVTKEMSEDELAAAIYSVFEQKREMAVQKITKDSVEFEEESKSTIEQITGVIKALRGT